MRHVVGSSWVERYCVRDSRVVRNRCRMYTVVRDSCCCVMGVVKISGVDGMTVRGRELRVC